jgi:hypothetical protein
VSFVCCLYVVVVRSRVRATRMVRVLSRAVRVRRHALVTWSRVVVRAVRVLLRACRRVVSRVVAHANSHDVCSRRRSHKSLFRRFDKIASPHHSR